MSIAALARELNSPIHGGGGLNDFEVGGHVNNEPFQKPSPLKKKPPKKIRAKESAIQERARPKTPVDDGMQTTLILKRTGSKMKPVASAETEADGEYKLFVIGGRDDTNIDHKRSFDDEKEIRPMTAGREASQIFRSLLRGSHTSLKLPKDIFVQLCCVHTLPKHHRWGRSR